MEGCDCRGVTHSDVQDERRNRINIGSCTANETKHGCEEIHRINSIQLEIVGGKIFCGKRSDTTFVSLERIDSLGECPQGQVICNPSASLDNKYCSPSIDSCPINDIKVLLNSDNSTNQTANVVKIDDTYSL